MPDELPEPLVSLVGDPLVPLDILEVPEDPVLVDGVADEVVPAPVDGVIGATSDDVVDDELVDGEVAGGTITVVLLVELAGGVAGVGALGTGTTVVDDVDEAGGVVELPGLTTVDSLFSQAVTETASNAASNREVFMELSFSTL